MVVPELAFNIAITAHKLSSDLTVTWPLRELEFRLDHQMEVALGQL